MYTLNVIVYIVHVQIPIGKIHPEEKIWLTCLILGILMFIFGFCSLILYFICSSSDSEDRLVAHQIELRNNKQIFKDGDKYEYFCNICDAVVNDKTKHCR